jgi:hypothetical protein
MAGDEDAWCGCIEISHFGMRGEVVVKVRCCGKWRFYAEIPRGGWGAEDTNVECGSSQLVLTLFAMNERPCVDLKSEDCLC